MCSFWLGVRGEYFQVLALGYCSVCGLDACFERGMRETRT